MREEKRREEEFAVTNSQKRYLTSKSKAAASSDGKDSDHTVFLSFMLSVNLSKPSRRLHAPHSSISNNLSPRVYCLFDCPRKN